MDIYGTRFVKASQEIFFFLHASDALHPALHAGALGSRLETIWEGGMVTDDVREKQAVGTSKQEFDVALP